MNDVQFWGVILDPPTYPKIGLHLCTFPYHTANTLFYSKNWIQLNSGKGLKSCHWYLVMSPSWAEVFTAWLVTFFLQLELFFSARKSENCHFLLPRFSLFHLHFHSIFGLLCCKYCFFLKWLIFVERKKMEL